MGINTGIYVKTALTGGGSGSLDAVDGDSLSDGDFAITFVGGTVYNHILDDDSGAAESSPDVVSPDSNPGTKRWILQTFNGAGGGGGANTGLSNLAAVAINTSLLSDTADTDDLGSTDKEWRNLYIGDAGRVYLGLTQDLSIHRSAANTMTLTASSGVITTAGLTIAGALAGVTTLGMAGDLTFAVGAARSITVATDNTEGDALSVVAGAGGTGDVAGGALNLTGGAAGSGGNNTGGAVAIAGGVDGGTGTGGAVTIRGGAGDTNGAVTIGDSDTTTVNLFTSANGIQVTGTALSPQTTDGCALGTTSLMFSDLFLASGSVINFNNGDVTLTHAANILTLAGGNFGVTGDVLFSAGGARSVSIDTDNTEGDALSVTAGSGGTGDVTGGALNLTGGAAGSGGNNTGGAVNIAGGVDGLTGTGGAVVIRGGAGNTNGSVTIGDSNTAAVNLFTSANGVKITGTAFSPQTTDGCALGSTSLMWADLFLASGSVINWNNGDLTLTHAADQLTFAGGSLDINEQLVYRAQFRDCSEDVNDIGDFSGGAQAIDYTLGSVVTATVSTSEVTFTFTNPPASGQAGSFTLILTNGGSQTVNWPSVDWVGGTAPTLTASGVDVLEFLTTDGGTTWYGFEAGIDMK